jgi:hypothetical protein
VQVVNITGQVLQIAELTTANNYSVAINDLPEGLNFVKASDGSIVKILTSK